MSESMHREWTDFKVLINTRNLSLQYTENNNYYNLFASEGNILWKCILTKGSADATDFENNYEVDANKEIFQDVSYKKGKGVKLTGKVVVTGSNTTVVEYTVPTNKVIFITDILVGGTNKDLKILKKNGSTLIRIYHPDYGSHSHLFRTPIKATSGQTIKVISKKAIDGTHIATLIGVKCNE